MKKTKLMMGMPITVEIVDRQATEVAITEVFDYFGYVDNKFSTYKESSEITKINKGKIKKRDWSPDMKTVFKLCEQTKRETDGYFNIKHQGKYDPSGLVKGWAIYNASNILKKRGFQNFYVEAGGDIQVHGKNKRNKKWIIGIRNPFNRHEVVKIIAIDNEGVATSGTYIRGQHVYDPKHQHRQILDIVSLTIIGPNIYEADRFATAAFAMEKKGIEFIERLPGFEGYMIDKNGIATYTSGFNNYVIKDDKTN